jgi:hypothetical protein
MCRDNARRVRRNLLRYYQRHKREHANFLASFTATPDAVCAECGTGLRLTRMTRRYCSNKCRQRAFRRRTPSGAQIRARLDQEVARMHAKLESHRRQKLVLRAAKGDQAAQNSLRNLSENEHPND